jgi:hypothetical protein
VRTVDQAGNRSEPAECTALQGITR